MLSASMLLAGGVAAHAGTLADVKARGVVRCGIGPNNPGFAFRDNQGNQRGFDIDFCRAIAAAIFGDPNKSEFHVVEPRDAFTVLTTGGVDVLTHRFTWTFNRDNGGGAEFTQALFYDGQAFMVRKSLGLKSVKDLNGATICAAQGTTTELNVADYFRQHNLTYKIVTFNGTDATRLAYDEGRCDAWTNDRGSLASRGQALKDPSQHAILPETISKEPVGPVVRDSDTQWAHLVRSVGFATVAAEELGLSSANVDEHAKTSTNPEVKRLLGVSDDLGQKLGLQPTWARSIIKLVGNYGEIFDRNLGANSPLNLSRGLNALWTNGGLLFSPPFR
ncbi:amino acid ABC transporter substrate-binding protein [Microvirga alba]|uniref:Amino acid ABC transporter substrate-binding protein n=1 Tax=Microvirga alba TaxID=2791025 RepID=A0A931BQX4_9HYPH|nr:amino acid ABC transporter substrate-binding protein [Microvirga alba]MBF9235286.1 amino acid ABC transporter substrate-binding protein [Microvirga alba]